MNITNFEMTQALLETFGGFICLLLTVVIEINRHQKKTLRKFRGLFLTTAIILFAEAAAYIFRGNTDALSLFVTRAGNFIVFLLNYLLANLVLRFIYSIMREHGFSPPKSYLIFSDICVITIFIVLIINISTNWMYYFDESNYYHRNFMWYFYAALSEICIFSGFILGIKCRKYITNFTLISIISYTVTPIICILIQSFIYGYSIVSLGLAVDIFIMLIAYIYEWSKSDEDNFDEFETRNKHHEILIMFLIMVIIMSSSIISCLISMNHISSQKTEDERKIVAHMVEQSIEKEFLKPIMVSETMSQDLSLKELLIEGSQTSAENVEDRISEYLESIRNGFGYQMVFAVSEDTKAFHTYNGISKFVDIDNDPHDIWYKDFIKSQKHYELNVDTDEANNWALSVFVNMEILGKNDELLGVCGVGVDMEKLKDMFREYEEKYSIKLNLCNSSGLIQIDTDGRRIENDKLDNSSFSRASAIDFYSEQYDGTNTLTQYMDTLGWYLVVTDSNEYDFNILRLSAVSVVIFFIGLIVMGAAFVIIVIREDKIKKELDKKRKDSIIDKLTNLYNRLAFEEDCEKLNQLGNLDDYIVGMLDVNGLKTVNDSLGHNAGDELIIGTANCIVATFASYGKAYRIGGDEFAVIVKCSPKKLEDLITVFDHTIDNWKGQYVDSISASKGFVICSEQKGLTLNEYKEIADKLMYEDKDLYYERTGKTRRVT